MWQAGFPAFFLLICSPIFHRHLTLCSQDHQKGVSEHTQGDVTVPSLPRSHLILIQAHLSFALFKTLLHGPTRSNSSSHLAKVGPTGCKDEHIGQVSGLFSADQAPSNNQPSQPPLLLRLAELDTGPIKLARSLAPIADREALPLVWGEPICDAIHPLALTLHFHLLRACDRQRLGLLARFQTCPQWTMTA